MILASKARIPSKHEKTPEPLIDFPGLAVIM